MTITLEIQPEVEKGLLAQATARGVSLADFVNEIVVREAQLSPEPLRTRTGQDLVDVCAKVGGLLTDEEVDMLFSRTPSFARSPILNDRVLVRHQHPLRTGTSPPGTQG